MVPFFSLWLNIWVWVYISKSMLAFSKRWDRQIAKIKPPQKLKRSSLTKDVQRVFVTLNEIILKLVNVYTYCIAHGFTNGYHNEFTY